MFERSRPTIAVVQICGFKLTQDSAHVFDDLYDMLPDHGDWEDLTLDFDPKDNDPHRLSPFDNCILLENVIGLRFHSVGDWPDGYTSWFDYEVEMIGIAETIDPWKVEILEAMEGEFEERERLGFQPDACSILTLWEGRSWQDWEGEYEFDYDYLGVLKDLKKAL